MVYYGKANPAKIVVPAPGPCRRRVGGVSAGQFLGRYETCCPGPGRGAESVSTDHASKESQAGPGQGAVTAVGDYGPTPGIFLAITLRSSLGWCLSVSASGKDCEVRDSTAVPVAAIGLWGGISCGRRRVNIRLNTSTAWYWLTVKQVRPGSAVRKRPVVSVLMQKGFRMVIIGTAHVSVVVGRFRKSQSG